MNGKQLKNSILQWAIQGKLVPQDPNDEPASVLLERIREEKARLVKEGKIKKDKNESIIFRGADNSHYEKFLATGEVKCIDDEIPFEIPEGWEWTRMGNIGEWGSGSTPQRGNSAYYGGNIPWLKTGELNDGIVYDTIEKITNKALKECSLRLNKVGDVLIAMYGATIGKVAIAGIELTTNQACCGCTPVLLYNEYLFYFLMASKVDFIKKGEGGAQPNISREKLVSHLMPVPPIEEQRRIVSTIKHILPYIETYSKHQHELDRLNKSIKPQLQKSILQEAIQGKLVPQDPNDEPAFILLEKIKAEKAKLVKDGKLKKRDLVDSVIFKGEDNKYYEQIGKEVVDISEDIPFEIPESWSWSRLSMLVNMRIGKTPARGDSTFWDNGVHAWISISDLSQGDIIMTSKEKISDFAAASVMGVKSQAGSLLMSFKLTVGKTAILGIDAYHNEAIVTISTMCDENYYTRNYLAAILPLLTNYGDTKDAIKGKTLNSQSLNALLIPIPPHEEQRRIIENIQYLFSKLR